MIQLAMKYPDIDNRFFRTEPPTTIEKLTKINRPAEKADAHSNDVYDDPDYSLLFEFHNNFIVEFKARAKQVKKDKSTELFFKDKDLLTLVNKFNADLTAFIVSDLIKDLPRPNVWSSNESDADLGEEAEDVESAKRSEKSMLERRKYEFIESYEQLILSIADKMARLNIHEFVKLGGLELLLLLYEKHKWGDEFVISISNCLCLASLQSQYSDLFVESGWLKRLNSMCKKLNPANSQNNLTSELAAHKILFNLNQHVEKRSSLFYSTTVYPLYPMYSYATKQAEYLFESETKIGPNKPALNNQHHHVTDVVFIHGLRGSLFRSWRQNESPDLTGKKPAVISQTNQAKTDKNRLLFIINTLQILTFDV
jgi:hypothetical protein